jgi:hypothetical protein
MVGAKLVFPGSNLGCGSLQRGKPQRNGCNYKPQATHTKTIGNTNRESDRTYP